MGRSEDRKEAVELMTQALENLKRVEQLVMNERIIKSRVFFGSIVQGISSSIFHVERLKYWIEFEKEYTKKGGK